MAVKTNGGRYCRCGTRLARDNTGGRCGACQARERDLMVGAPEVPAEFWTTDLMRDALATWHMGRVIAAYRNHPFHDRPLSQEVVGGWMGVTQAHLSRIERGAPLKDLDRLIEWAQALRIPAHLLWFKLPEHRPTRPQGMATDPASEGVPGRRTMRFGVQPPSTDTDEMRRREFLNLLSVAGIALATSSIAEHLDLERVDYFANRPGGLDAEAVEAYEALNTHLWGVFAATRSKAGTLPLVREQLDVLTGALQEVHEEPVRQRLCALTSDLFQLAGEIFFDGNQYADAAQRYALAATAAREAGAFDLWACALVRHAFVDVYGRRFDRALPTLGWAAGLARRGDRTLSTRHWVDVVRAQALAGLGDLDACQRALDSAEGVCHLSGNVHNGGWLRFDASRLAEERGTCYVKLGHPTLAEAALNDALSRVISLRRRGIVLTDLAMVGVQRRDLEHLVVHADAALDVARRTGSGVVARKLQGLRGHLEPFLADGRVRHLNARIASLGGVADPRRW